MDTSLVLALLAGVALAAAAGLRAFLPLLALGIAARLHWIALRPDAQWMAGDQALLALGVAAVLEIAADKIPIVDHALDVLGSVLRPAAGWVAGYAVLTGWGTPWAQIAALVLGAGALAVHAVKAKTRVGSTALTLGHANPALSLAEDGASMAFVVTALLAPLLALAGLLIALAWALRRRRRPGPAGSGAARAA